MRLVSQKVLNGIFLVGLIGDVEDLCVWYVNPADRASPLGALPPHHKFDLASLQVQVTGEHIGEGLGRVRWS